MQRLATYIFKVSSIVFGILGILVVLIAMDGGSSNELVTELLMKSLMISVFIILPSFAVSIACKYLETK